MNSIDLPPHLSPHLEGQSSWLSKLTSARVLGHPLVWSAMTAFFILLGYFWLEYYARPISDDIIRARDTDHSRGTSIGSAKGNWNPDIYQPIITKEVMPITRNADILRAENYRETIEQENLIQPLLSAAREYLEDEHYVRPDQQDAWHQFQKILALDDQNTLALSGQAQIAGTLEENADIALSQSDYETSERWLSQLDTIQPNHSFQKQLRQKIADQISDKLAKAEAAQRKVERLQRLKSALEDAKSAMAFTPSKLRVAYDLYQRALELDETNETALSGLRQIHLKRIETAKLTIAKGDYDAAQTEIRRLQETNADKNQIDDLITARRIAQARSLEQEDVQPLLPKAPQIQTPDTTDNLSSLPIAQTIPTPKISPLADQTQMAQTQGVQTSEIVVRAPVQTNLDVSENQAPRITPNEADKSQQLNTGIKAYYAGDYNQAFEKLHPLAEDNIARAQFRLGIMYYQGRTVVKNEDLAQQWIARALPVVLRAAQQSEAWAQSDLGTAYELGIGLKKDVSHAAGLYEKAAQQGYAGAQTNLGVLYGMGDGVKYDRQVAVYWLKQAAAQGDKIAEDNLRILNAR